MSDRICAVDGCDHPPPFSRGWCSMHYQRWTDHGDLNHVREKKIWVPPECKVGGCARSASRRGWCAAHYQRWKKTGSLHLKPQPTTEQRFWAFVDASVPGGCWHWTGFVGPFGYGQWGYGFKETLRKSAAHRFAYEFAVGPIRDGLHVDHICHNTDWSCPGGPECLHRRCVNPAHLEAITQAENNRRAARHRMQGRSPKRKRKPGVIV